MSYIYNLVIYIDAVLRSTSRKDVENVISLLVGFHGGLKFLDAFLSFLGGGSRFSRVDVEASFITGLFTCSGMVY